MKSCDVCPDAGKIGSCRYNDAFNGLVTQPRPWKPSAGVEGGRERRSQLAARQSTARTRGGRHGRGTRALRGTRWQGSALSPVLSVGAFLQGPLLHSGEGTVFGVLPSPALGSNESQNPRKPGVGEMPFILCQRHNMHCGF